MRSASVDESLLLNPWTTPWAAASPKRISHDEDEEEDKDKDEDDEEEDEDDEDDDEG